MTLKIDKEFFKNLDPTLSSNESSVLVKLNKIPMPWDNGLTHVDKVNMNEQDIIMALDNLKELGVSRRVVVRFLIQEVRDIFGGNK